MNTIRSIEGECNENAGSILSAKMGCAESALISSDRLLNKQYQEIKNSFQSTGEHLAAKQRFISEERAWISYRDNMCSQYQQTSVNFKMCLYRETSKRIEELFAQYPYGYYATDEEKALEGHGGQGQITDTP